MGGQTHPTFHPTLVFSMLDELLDAFDRGLSPSGSELACQGFLLSKIPTVAKILQTVIYSFR